MVEEDLTEVFGRGQVTAELEAQFKDAMKVEKFTLLSHGCEIRLDSGPGLVMRNVFRPAVFGNSYTAVVASLDA